MKIAFVFDRIALDRGIIDLCGEGIWDPPLIKYLVQCERYRHNFLFTTIDEIVQNPDLTRNFLCFYTVGLAQFPHLKHSAWFGATASATLLQDKLRRIAGIDGVYLLLDFSWERMTEWHVDRVPEVMQRLNFPMSRLAIISSHAEISAIGGALRQFGVTIFGAWFWEIFSHTMFADRHDHARMTLNKRVALAMAKQLPYERLFVCLNRRPRLHRILICAYLYNNDLLKSGFVSFGGAKIDNNRAGFEREMAIAKYVGREALGDDFVAAIDRFAGLASLDLDTDFGNAASSFALATKLTDEILPMYDASLISIITESDYGSSFKDVFLTEKVFKPILYGHPHIILSSPGTYAELEHLGYHGYNPLVDEAHDTVIDPAARFRQTITNIQRFLERLPTNVPAVMQQLLSIAIKNQENFISNTPARAIGALRDLSKSVYRSRFAQHSDLVGKIEPKLLQTNPEYYAATLIQQFDRSFYKMVTHRSAYVRVDGGFHRKDFLQDGQFCSATGRITLALAAGGWTLLLRSGLGTSKIPLWFLVNGTRVNPIWHSDVAMSDWCMFDITLHTPNAKIEIMTPEIRTPSELDERSTDYRQVSFWLFDDIAIGVWPAVT